MSSNHARCVNEIILIRGEAPSLHQANSTGTLASAWKSHCHAQINGYFQIFVLREWKKKGHDSLVHSPLVLFRKNILQSSLFIIFNRFSHHCDDTKLTSIFHQSTHYIDSVISSAGPVAPARSAAVCDDGLGQYRRRSDGHGSQTCS